MQGTKTNGLPLEMVEDLYSTITSFFPDMELNISELQDPKPQFIQYFFSLALVEFGVDHENLKKPQFGQPNDMPQILQLNFLKAVKTVFPFLNIGLFDLISPSSPQKSLSLIRQTMEYLSFCDERAMTLETKSETQQRALTHAKVLSAERELLNQKKNQLALDNSKYLKTLHEMNEQIVMKQRELQEFVQMKNKLVETGDEVKTSAQRYQQTRDMLITQTAAVDSEIDRMQNELAERWRNLVDTHDMEEHLARKDELEKEKQKQWEKMKAKKKMGEQYNDALNLLLEQHTRLISHRKLTTLNSELKKDLVSTQKLLSDFQEELLELQQTEKGVDTALVANTESMSQLAQQTDQTAFKLKETIADKHRVCSRQQKEVKGLKEQKSRIEEELEEQKKSEEAIRNTVEANIKLFYKAKSILDRKLHSNAEKIQLIRKQLQELNK